MNNYEYQIYNNETGEILKAGTVKGTNRTHAEGMVHAQALGEGIDFLAGDIRTRLLSLDPMAAELTIEKLMRDHNITQTQLSKRFGIPYRTIQNWKALGKNRRECPDYVLRMMNEILSNEKK